MFVDCLVEAHYVRMFLQLSKMPYFTTLQKFTDKINNTLLERIIAPFILLTDIKQIFLGTDSSGSNLHTLPLLH